MGKLIVLISTTPDGFAESQNVIIDPPFFEFTQSLMDLSDTVLFGRKTYEQFKDRWQSRFTDETSPGFIRQMARTLNDISKVVFSSTLETSNWNNTKVMTKPEANFINSFKANDKQGLLTFGSLSLVESLIEMDMVDEYYFNIQPLIPGKGEARFFNNMNLKVPRPLKYIDCIQLTSGAHIIHYQNCAAVQ